MKVLLTLSMLFAFATTFAQDTLNQSLPLLRHEMTPEELLRKNEIGRGFVETDPPAGPVRNIAEYERMQGALVRYPFGIPISLIREMAEDVRVTTIVASSSQKNTVINQYIANGVDTSHCDFLIAPTNSYWTRDYGPWFAADSSGDIGIVDFPYNRPRPDDDEIPKKMAEMLGISWYGMNVIHTGGNYMCDGFGVGSSTDLVYVENPSQTTAEVDQKMNDYLGITNHEVVPDPNISTGIDHIDCWGKFLAPGKILIRKTLQSDPEYNALESQAAYWASQTSSFGYPYKVYRVMTPQDQPYTNSVILNNKVLVPYMNSVWDDSAKAAYEAAMPGYEVIGFIGNPSTPWMSTDALHCRAIGLADIGMLRISHIPVSSTQPSEYPVAIQATITASSGFPVIQDSVKVWFRVNGGGWLSTLMNHTSGRDYMGYIPPQPDGSEIDYYLSAADESGRSETMPLVGSAAAYSYETEYSTLTPVPDTLWFRSPEDCQEGKLAILNNFTSNVVSLNFLQMNGINTPWYVDSVSSAVPVAVNPGGAFTARVRVHILLSASGDTIFIPDSLHFNTSTGSLHLIVMVDEHLISSVQNRDLPGLTGTPAPNPFVHQVTVPILKERAGEMELSVFSVEGLKIKSLKTWPGQSGVTWDGTNDDGQRLSPGVYLLKAQSNGLTSVKRLILMKE
jgi:agmatine/peptidylarginine deiminase